MVYIFLPFLQVPFTTSISSIIIDPTLPLLYCFLFNCSSQSDFTEYYYVSQNHFLVNALIDLIGVLSKACLLPLNCSNEAYKYVSKRLPSFLFTIHS